jgi:hypothetical protein
MGAMPFGRTGIGHRLHDLVLGTKRRGPPLGFAAHRAKNIEPDLACIAGLIRERDVCTGTIV